MFQFRRFPTYAYLIQRTLPEYCSGGFPHSEIPGSMDICSSPRLIAACHVLRRLLMPRHSPCALYSLTSRTILIDLFSSLNYAGLTKKFSLANCFYPSPFGVVPQLNMLPSRFSSERPLCCLALLLILLPLFSFQGAIS